ncbi:MAG TPA: glycine cleavage system aminomethyltransferase GcvT [Arenicellales bacterium]|nr:glycine cleavage system protein T [Acidiferrobacteraceae bacterium]MDP6122356.1 glycine cleavage system aminomethyltransferase GcvT [Arenicellales bacterium]HJP26935.1 glycine cleavage system aminomethyltransferase GcvT [Arenicellales bacterium]|tara:strand:+ start:706 stop:1824 length:1119 start_codon:yes stop_codon:yes gene_type:complete
MDRSPALETTPLDPLHRELGGKMVPFAGYAMPVQYPGGIIKEHLHTRDQAGLFDVSHMGQIRLHGSAAARELEALVTADIVDLAPGQQRYTLFTNPDGGIVDDLMVANGGDHLFLVVNAACKEQDINHLRANITAEMELLSTRALLALQGPAAQTVLERVVPGLADLHFMQAMEAKWARNDLFITRSGYTGEDGFEISLPSDCAEEFARWLISQPEVLPVGLGARDSLRLEAGLCLYGHDITAETTPIEARLGWAISSQRRNGGDRAGGFPGSKIILKQMSEGAEKMRVGLRATGRAPVREGAPLVESSGRPIGVVTSGGYGPSLAAPVAMGYLPPELSEPGTVVGALVRGKRVEIEVSPLPFIKQRYYRGK